MSIDATRWAWSLQGIRPTQKLVLLSLADRAGENHVCWPSLQRLAFDTGLDVKTIRTCLIDLAQAGIVSRREVRGRGYEYTLVGVEGRENQTILTDYRKTASKKPFSENATPTSFGRGIDNHQYSNDNFLDTPTSLGTPTKTGTGTDLGTPPLPVSVPHPYQFRYPTPTKTGTRIYQEPIKNRSENLEESVQTHTRTRSQKPKPQKLTFGEYANVKLTAEEHGKLIAAYGEDKTADAIAFLDIHLGARAGKDPYKSHYLALRKWVFDAVEERKAKKQAAPSGRTQAPMTARQAEAAKRGEWAKQILKFDEVMKNGEFATVGFGTEQGVRALSATDAGTGRVRAVGQDLE